MESELSAANKLTEIFSYTWLVSRIINKCDIWQVSIKQ